MLEAGPVPIHHLHRTIELPLPLAEIFPFFADAANLAALTPSELRFRFVTPLPIEMRVGALIEYRLRLFGVPFAWRTRIDCWQPNAGFVDRQLNGPFRRWVHRHEFREVAGGTLMEDHVEWALPLQPIGELARPLVRAQLERIFDFRSVAIRRILLGEGGAG
jgi:ligand-binding SRPBCC domain-containing protein